MSRPRRACAVIAWILLTIGDVSTSAAVAQPPDDEGARIHYDAGSRFYEVGRFHEALREFEAAYELSHRPALLFNMARCRERLGRIADAARDYRAFLAAGPPPEEREAVTARLRQLEGQLADRPRRVRQPLPAYPFVVGGVGLGLLGAAIGTGVVAIEREDALTRNCPAGACPLAYPEAGADRALGSGLAIATDVLIGVGAAALVVGVVTLGVHLRRHRPVAYTPPGRPGLRVDW